MAFSKSGLYEKEFQIQSEFHKAFGHSARIKIIEQLCLKGPLTVEELMREHHVSYATMSDHLRILRVAHLVHCKEKCPYTYYRVNWITLMKVENYFMEYFKKVVSGRMELRRR